MGDYDGLIEDLAKDMMNMDSSWDGKVFPDYLICDDCCAKESCRLLMLKRLYQAEIRIEDCGRFISGKQKSEREG